MQNKIVSLLIEHSNYLYQKIPLNALSIGFDSSVKDELSFAGICREGEIIIGNLDDFYHVHLADISLDILDCSPQENNVFFFALFYSEDYHNSGGRAKFEDEGGILLGSTGWGMWPYSSENERLYGHSLLPELYADIVADVLDDLPEIYVVERP